MKRSHLSFRLISLCGLALVFTASLPAGADDLPPTSEFFDEYDADADGKVTSSEFRGSTEIFDLLDKNGDGSITPSELGLPADYKPVPRQKKRAPGREAGARPGRGGKKAANRAEELRKRLVAMDTNKDGKVSREEWQGPEGGFARLDRNKDGVLDKADRRGGGKPGAPPAERRGDGKPDAAEEEARRARVAQHFKDIDKNADGKLTADEVPNPKLLEAADADKDGAVSKEEFSGFMQERGQAARRSGGKGRPGGKRRRGGKLSAGMLTRWDRDDDGKVSADEFPGRDKAFQRFDVDKDGYLTEADIAAAQAGTDKKPGAPTTTPSGSGDPFRDQDADGDGKLTRAEFRGTNADWRALDKNGDGYVTRDEAGK